MEITTTYRAMHSAARMPSNHHIFTHSARKAFNSDFTPSRLTSKSSSLAAILA